MERAQLREDRIHGNAMYPVSVYPDIQQLNGDSILDCHWHDEMEFTMVTQGSAVFQIDMNRYEVKAGEAIFVHRGRFMRDTLRAMSLVSSLPLYFIPICSATKVLMQSRRSLSHLYFEKTYCFLLTLQPMEAGARKFWRT